MKKIIVVSILSLLMLWGVGSASANGHITEWEGIYAASILDGAEILASSSNKNGDVHYLTVRWNDGSYAEPVLNIGFCEISAFETICWERKTLRE